MDWYTSDLGRPKFSPVSNSTFLKMISFKTKSIAFFGVKSRCFLPRLRSPTKPMWYAIETLSFQDSAIRATQSSNVFKKHQYWLYKHSHSSGFVSTLCCKRATGWLNSSFNKIKFICAIVTLMSRNRYHNFFDHIYHNWFFDCNSFRLLRYL